MSVSRPDRINILGIIYTVEYVDKPSEVDVYHRSSLWGQIDFWTRSIRVFSDGVGETDIWQIIMHEVLHGIANLLHLDVLLEEQHHDDLDVLALALVDVLTRNGWMELAGPEEA